MLFASTTHVHCARRTQLIWSCCWNKPLIWNFDAHITLACDLHITLACELHITLLASSTRFVGCMQESGAVYRSKLTQWLLKLRNVKTGERRCSVQLTIQTSIINSYDFLTASEHTWRSVMQTTQHPFYQLTTVVLKTKNKTMIDTQAR